MIARLGIGGGTGHVIEYRGSAIRALSMEERMTVCNMSIEAGARAGMIAPDETTFAYLKGRPRAPPGRGLGRRRSPRGAQLPSDDGRGVRSRGEVRRRRAGADDHLRHQPGHGHPDRRRGSRACQRDRREGAGVHGPRRPSSRCWATRSTSCSSAAAPTRGCPICAPRPACSRGARSPTGCACWWSRARRRSRRRPRPRGWIACSARRAPSGARRAVRCASR